MAFFFFSCLLLISPSALGNDNPLFEGFTINEVKQHLLTGEADLSAQWHALLHMKDHDVLIQDTHFILSGQSFSPRNELLKTLDAFYRDPKAICRFPARLRWITQELGLMVDEARFLNCTEYQRYLKKAPAETISLIFASENLLNPTTMMGHSFLMIRGKDDQDQALEHTISYYTPLQGIPLPSLIIRSFSTGLPGVFGLIPYRESLNRYLLQEQRNVWEYELQLSRAERRLIHDHIWELKNISSRYLFVGHNCATLTAYLLAVVRPEILQYDRHWQTPKNLVSAVFKSSLIKKQQVHLATKWKTLMLATRLSNKEIRQLTQSAEAFSEPLQFSGHPVKDYIRLEFLQGLKMLHETPSETDAKWYNDALGEYKNHYKKTPNIDLTRFKRPDKTPEDSQLTLGFRQGDRAAWILDLAPTAHRLMDDNRQYFSESELLIGALMVEMEHATGALRIKNFDLYKVRAFPAYQPIFRQPTVSFSLGYFQQYHSNLNQEGAINLSAGLGQTFPLTSDMDFYGLLEIGIASGGQENFGYLEPKLGLIIREIWNMKSHIEWKAGINVFNQSDMVHQLRWQQAIHLSSRHAVVAEWSWLWSTEKEGQTGSIGYRFYF